MGVKTVMSSQATKLDKTRHLTRFAIGGGKRLQAVPRGQISGSVRSLRARQRKHCEPGSPVLSIHPPTSTCGWSSRGETAGAQRRENFTSHPKPVLSDSRKHTTISKSSICSLCAQHWFLSYSSKMTLDFINTHKRWRNHRLLKWQQISVFLHIWDNNKYQG